MREKENCHKILNVYALSGGCQYSCCHCFLRRQKARKESFKMEYSGTPHINPDELKRICGHGRTVVASKAVDLFADNVPDELIEIVLERCCSYGKNRYVFKTMNPERFQDFLWQFPPKTILATTVEGPDAAKYSKAPLPAARLIGLRRIAGILKNLPRRPQLMVSVDPVLSWPACSSLIRQLHRTSPDIIEVGANTARCKVDEPTGIDLAYLIGHFRDMTSDVRLNNNLERILGKDTLSKLQSGINWNLVLATKGVH